MQSATTTTSRKDQECSNVTVVAFGAFAAAIVYIISQSFQRKQRKGTFELLLDATLMATSHTSNVFDVRDKKKKTRRKNRDVFRALIVLWALEKDNEDSVVAAANEVDELSQRELRRASRYMRCASAAYGYLLLNGTFYDEYSSAMWQKLSSLLRGTDPNLIALQAHCGIPESCVVDKMWGDSNVTEPGHFLAVTDSEILLVVRGTFGISDSITDMMASPVEFRGYANAAHEGMLRAAHRKVDRLGGEILKLARERKNLEIVVTGHSLGAGVASLVALLLHDAYPSIRDRLSCYAFACPALLAKEIASCAEVKRIVKTFVLDADIVPRLSLRSMRRLRYEIQWAHDVALKYNISVGQTVRAAAEVMLHGGVEENRYRKRARDILGLPSRLQGHQNRRQMSVYVRSTPSVDETEGLVADGLERTSNTTDVSMPPHSSDEDGKDAPQKLYPPGSIYFLRSTKMTWARSSKLAMARCGRIRALVTTNGRRHEECGKKSTASVGSNFPLPWSASRPSVLVFPLSDASLLRRILISWRSGIDHTPWNYDIAFNESIALDHISERLASDRNVREGDTQNTAKIRRRSRRVFFVASIAAYAATIFSIARAGGGVPLR